jgi:xanthine dehydrogenase YagR molybdenum-binding subunit
MSVLGAPLDRVDGPLKVTGSATFTAEHPLPRLCYAKLLFSTIANGSIRSFNTQAMQRAPGFIAVLTPDNAPPLPERGRAGVEPPAGRVLSLLQDPSVAYNGQPIGVVIAETLEQATYAASLARISYDTESPQLEFAAASAAAHAPKPSPQAKPDYSRGDFDAAQASAPVRIEQTYSTPVEHHNPMEPHATIASWDSDRLTIYDSTQYVSGVQKTLSKVLGIAPQQIHVISPYVGGGFGCKGSMWSHVALAAMAARRVGRPVKLVLERTEMFGPVGARPRTEQRLQLGARHDGSLVAVSHSVLSHTSLLEDFTEPSATVTRMLYECPNLKTRQRLVALNVGTTTFQRAPGESTGTFALEVAMDELAVATGTDPVELRLRNYAEREPESGRPWSSKSLRECYADAAHRFGWASRGAPRTMRDGDDWIGWGMATATYPANRMKASARARYLADGSAEVATGTQELGTGSYTVLTQVAADTLGLNPGDVRLQLGDTTLPEAPVSGGSMTVASVSPAVQAACLQAREGLLRRCLTQPLPGLSANSTDALTVADGWVLERDHPERRVRIAAVLALAPGEISGTATTAPGPERQQYAMHSFGAVFAEVRVDADLGRVRVPRIVGTYGVGRLLNRKTGISQLVGGIVWGVGMALMESSEFDLTTGRILNANLADYHVPVHADIETIDVAVLDEVDAQVNPLGAKGIGEIGITGVAAALANAVFHATGRRVRSLPLTVEQLL